MRSTDILGTTITDDMYQWYSETDRSREAPLHLMQDAATIEAVRAPFPDTEAEHNDILRASKRNIGSLISFHGHESRILLSISHRGLS